MRVSKYRYEISYFTSEKTIAIAIVLDEKEKDIARVVKSKIINPEHVAWVLIHYLKSNNLKEIKTKFGTLELKEDLKSE